MAEEGVALKKTPAGMLGAAVIAYLILSAITHAHLTGDAPMYVTSISDRLHGVRNPRDFWDAGHLLWRPAGYAIARILEGVSAPVLGATSTPEATEILIILSWVGGALSSLLLPLWLTRRGVGHVAAVASTLAITGANGFLFYFQSGTSYIPGLACLVAALLALDHERSSRALEAASGVVAGIAAALAVLFWLPYVLALPAILLAPLIFEGADRPSIRTTTWAVLTCACVGLGVYGAVMAHLHIASPSAFLTWLSEASHGITGVGGVRRAVFGFSRSFFDMGTDGTLMKRYLLHDPYNPVSLGALLRGSLYKFFFFYLTLAILLWGLWRSRAHRVMTFCVLAAVPVLGFAVFWQGGDTERYFPLYPAFALALGVCLTGSPRATIARRVVPAALVALMLVVNVPVYSKQAFAARAETLERRISMFTDATLPLNSLVVIPIWSDPLVVYYASGAAHPPPLGSRVPLYGLLQPGTESAPAWRQEFAVRATRSLASRSRVWVSRRLVSARPASDWGWTEGDDPRLAWADFPSFFSRFDLTSASGGNDGYVELLPTPHNLVLLREALPKSSP